MNFFDDYQNTVTSFLRTRPCQYVFCSMILFALSSTVSLAEKMPTVEAEFRTDFQWQDNDDEDDVNLSRPTFRFIVKRAHLNLTGKMDDQIGYRLRVRWNQSFEPQDDNTGMGLEYWYLKYQWSPALQWRIGKHHILQGGREGAHNPIDIFQYSQLGERIKDFYEVGISAFYDLGKFAPTLQGQTMVGQFFNQTEGSSENQYTLVYNIAWYGSFADGLIEPIVQYGVFPHAQERTQDDTTGKRTVSTTSYQEKFFSLGVLVNLDNYIVEMDAISQYQDAYNSETTRYKAEDNTSIIILGRREGDQFSPFIKWIYDSTRPASVTAKDTGGNEIELGTEYFPQAGNHKYRLHTFFAYRETTDEQNTYSEYRLNFGASARF
ncbi:MAG: hypothetical protein HQM14_11785 [SAR324 cluster bacterium]|nr:hypothetical protein [SAR324 cluster bacterium]